MQSKQDPSAGMDRRSPQPGSSVKVERGRHSSGFYRCWWAARAGGHDGALGLDSAGTHAAAIDGSKGPDPVGALSVAFFF